MQKKLETEALDSFWPSIFQAMAQNIFGLAPVVPIFAISTCMVFPLDLISSRNRGPYQSIHVRISIFICSAKFSLLSH